MSELNSLGLLQGKREAIINNNTDDNNDNNNNNNNNSDFQKASDDVLNYQTIEEDLQKISKFKPYINKYNWEGIEFPAGQKEWIKFERNNKTIVFNVLYVQYNTKKISVAYRSEYNNKRNKQVVLLMTTNGKKYH